MIRVTLITLGCPKNQVDSEYMESMLKNEFKIVKNSEEAEVIIINTCGFIEDAKQESIDTILEAARYKEEGNCRALIVTGCLTQRYKEKIINEIPEIDAILGTGNFDKIVTTVKKVLTGDKVNKIDSPDFDYRYDLPRNITNNHYTYIKIAEGCNNNCSYCAIPNIRGKVKSRPIEDIYKEIKNLNQTNIKEIILIAQDITQYGIDIYNDSALVSLLEKIVSLDNIKWIRLLYSYPERITQQLINLIKNESIICNYLDLPIQHSSNKIRKKMGRKGKRKEIIDLINTLRTEIEDISIRTSLIVGFPGETEKDFQDLKKFIKKIKFDRLGVFKYSREEGTAAANFNDQISSEIKEKRYDEIMKIQQEISLQKNKQYIGKNIQVLIDEIYKDYAVGRSQYDAPEIDNQIIIYNTELKPGDLIKCKITDAYEYDLIGEEINEFTK
ncbi:MAG: 30S ribosomal protein S12 methylthiotransferase RimO [bacterium]